MDGSSKTPSVAQLIKAELIEDGTPRALFDYMDARILEVVNDRLCSLLGDLEENLTEKFITKGTTFRLG